MRLIQKTARVVSSGARIMHGLERQSAFIRIRKQNLMRKEDGFAENIKGINMKKEEFVNDRLISKKYTNICLECDGILRIMDVEYSYKGKSFGKYKADVCDKNPNHIYFYEKSVELIQKKAKELGLWGTKKRK